MGLVRSWFRELSRALGFSLVLPVFLLIAAAGVGVSGGGLSGLGEIGQLVSGPRAPELALSDELDRTPETVLPTSTELAADGIVGSSGDPDGTVPGDDRDDRDDDRRDDDDGPDRDRDGYGDGDGPGDGGGGGGPPQDRPGPLRQLGETTKGLTDDLPGPLGPLTGQAIDEVVRVGEQLLPPRSDSLLGPAP